MATVASSVLVFSEPRGERKRNRYRFTMDNGDVHERLVMIPQATDNAAHMAATAVIVLDEAVQAEINAILGSA